MYTSSETYTAAIAKFSRHFEAKLYEEDTEIESEVKTYTLRKYSSTGEDITIGGAFSVSLEMTLLTDVILKNRTLTLCTGLDGEYIPDGQFVITQESLKAGVKTITGYDKMYVCGSSACTLSSTDFPMQASKFATLLAEQLGCVFDETSISEAEDIEMCLTEVPTGTVQEMCGYLAGILGKNAYIDRNGRLTFQSFIDFGYSLDADRTGEVDIDSTARTIYWVQCQVDEDTVLKTGSGSGYLSLYNPLMTQDILDNISNKISGFTYFGASVPLMLGDNRLDPWDIILYESDEGNAKILCNEIVQTFDGGLQTDITSCALSESEEGNTQGPIQAALAQLSKTSSQMIVSVDIFFAQSTSNTEAPTQGWQTKAPEWKDSYYMWQKTVTTYANGTMESSEPICVSGAAGQTGTSVLGITECYYSSESATELTGGEWSYESPVWAEARYIWTKSIILYSDGTTTETAPFCTSGQKGEAGAKGEDATVLRIDSSRGTVFKNDMVSTVLSVAIYHGSQRITDSQTLKNVFGDSAYLQWSWQRLDDETFGVISSSDSRFGDNGFTFTLSPDDVDTKITFMCELIT